MKPKDWLVIIIMLGGFGVTLLTYASSQFASKETVKVSFEYISKQLDNIQKTLDNHLGR